jgi:rubredoxin
MVSEHRFVNITMTDLLWLLERAEELLTREDFEQLNVLVETLIELTRLVRQKGSTIARLRRLVGLASSERDADVLVSEGDTDQKSASKESSPSPRRKRKGHGRIAASDYKAASHISVGHESLAAGCTCPSCERGKLYLLKKSACIVRIFGQEPLAATCWDLEKQRCSGCGEVFTAQPPPEAAGSKHDETAVTMMALLRYGAGMPLHRLQRLQSEFETPLPASTQWDVVSKRSV